MPVEPKKLRRAFRVVAATEEGQVVLDYLASFCRVGEDLFVRTSNERENCYMQGRQSVALEIERQLQLEVKDE